MRAIHSPSRDGCARSRKRVEGGRDEDGRGAQHRVFALEREVRQQHVRVRARRRTRARRGSRRHRAAVDDDGGDRVAERRRVGRGGDAPRRASASGLAGDERDEQLLLAREAPVDGGPGAAGLAGDVVERGLGQPDPRDAGEGRVEDPDAWGSAPRRKCIA